MRRCVRAIRPSFLIAPLAFAIQCVPVHADDAGLELEEIVVTAQRRAESILEVPISMAVETGAPLYVLAVLRDGGCGWVGHIERIDVPTTGSRHERVRGTLDRQVRAFERLVAHAPEQWWTLLFRIWEDIPPA